MCVYVYFNCIYSFTTCTFVSLYVLISYDFFQKHKRKKKKGNTEKITYHFCWRTSGIEKLLNTERGAMCKVVLSKLLLTWFFKMQIIYISHWRNGTWNTPLKINVYHCPINHCLYTQVICTSHFQLDCSIISSYSHIVGKMIFYLRKLQFTHF